MPMAINVKVIKGLMDPIILGWDWMYKYGVKMDPANGKVLFGQGLSAPLLEQDLPHLGAYYRAAEEITLPPHSKVHTNVELLPGGDPWERAPTSVITEPFEQTGAPYHVARTCSRIKDQKFLTELINVTNYMVRIPAGEILGYAECTDDEKFAADSVPTDMFCAYRCENAQEVDEGKPQRRDPSGPPPSKTPPPLNHPDDSEDAEIPPGAKPLKLDLSEIAEDAQPYKGELLNLYEKHKKVFSRHDRDYGRTSLIQYRAHMKDPDQVPIAHPPYRTRPEMREVIDQQAHQMIADGLVGPSISPYSAPIMLARKSAEAGAS